MTKLINSIDRSLRSRAEQVIPGGMWGHMSTRYLGDAYPQFFARAAGCRLWDVDGNEYVELMCSWGPIVLGHHHPAVEDAARRQRERGDSMNGPGDVLVELAELMVDTVPHADWVMFQKNGTDATTACVTLARAGTGRRKVLVARGSYHGAVPWCTPSLAGVTTEDRAHLIHFDYNDVQSLEEAVDQAGSDLAAIIVTAFRHDIGRDQEMPTARFAQRARQLCDLQGAALIVDDVRAGFRIDLGGSWEPLGVRPDLSAWSKAIANGYPLAFVAGIDALSDAARSVYSTGSFWCGSASMAAALATLDVLDAGDAVNHMGRMGDRLRSGLAKQAASHGVGIRQTGPSQMPQVLFDDDADFAKGFRFTSEALRRGVYLHPKHNMFLSLAHTEDDIDRALEATEEAMRVVGKG
jgi:glutamate-1-semialdehyde 2,1-aminomutase